MIAQWIRIKIWNFLAPLLFPHLDECMKKYTKSYNDWMKDQEGRHQEIYKIQIENADVLKEFARITAEDKNSEVHHRDFTERLDRIAAAIEKKS